jgi:Dolichyl-phosphate-mannose-protein mannosyltransferase
MTTERVGILPYVAGTVAPGALRWRALLAAAAGAGIALRVWVLDSPIGGLDADEAVWGLMARHTLEGELSTFFWGQAYGGTQETFLTAGLFALVGSGTVAVRIVPIALAAVAALLVWRIGRRTVGEPAAALAAALFWVWPSYLVWKSTRAHGFYGAALVLALVVVLLALRLRERPSRRDAAALGLAAGLGWWATPQTAFLAAPAIAWLLWRRPAFAREAPLALGAALVGAAPWLAWSVRHGWATLEPPFGGDTGGYLDHLRTFFAATFPTLLGLRAPFTLDWLPGELAGRALELAAVVLLVLAVRRRRLEPLVVLAVAYPLVAALSPFGSLNEEPRYLVLLAPVVALLVAALAAPRWWTATGAVALALVSSIAGLRSMSSIEPPVPPVGGLRVPADLDPVLRALDDAGETRVRAHYAIAYRITFESGERIVAASTTQVRHEPYQRIVADDPSPAFVGVRDADWLVRVRR